MPPLFLGLLLLMGVAVLVPAVYPDKTVSPLWRWLRQVAISHVAWFQLAIEQPVSRARARWLLLKVEFEDAWKDR